MRKKILLLVFVVTALVVVACREAATGRIIPTITKLVQPSLTVSPTETLVPTEEPTPEAVFDKEVGYIPGAFPGVGGENWIFTEVKTVSFGGEVNTDIVKQEGFTPLAQEGSIVAILAEGANDTSFFLVPRLDQAQYIKPDGLLGVAKFDAPNSYGLVSAYTDGGLVIYKQPLVMANYNDGTYPLLGREDATGNVWVLYVAGDGSITRRAPAFFGPEDQVEVADGRVLINGQAMRIDTDTEFWVAYQEVYSGEVQQGAFETIVNLPPEFLSGAEVEKVPNTPILQASLREQGFAVVVNSEGNASTLYEKEGIRLAQLLVPDPSQLRRETFTKIEDKTGMTLLGNAENVTLRLASAINLTPFPKELFAISAIPITEEEATLADVKVLLVDDQGKIYGRMTQTFIEYEGVGWREGGPLIVKGRDVYYFELEKGITFPETEKWYENLTQTQMAEIVKKSQRLYKGNSLIPLNRIEVKDRTSEQYPDIQYSLVKLNGIALDWPKVETIPVTNYNGQEKFIPVYTVPYLLQSISGAYVVKDMLIGWYYDLYVTTTLSRHHRLNPGISQTFTGLTAHEVATKLTPMIQHQIELLWWAPGIVDFDMLKATISDESNERRFEYYYQLVLGYRYWDDSRRFIDLLRTGASAGALTHPVYVGNVSEVAFNVE